MHMNTAIDGKHVRIQALPHSGSQYYNYKGYYSIIMLAVVDANYKFMYVDVGFMVQTPTQESSGIVDCLMPWNRTKLGCHLVNNCRMGILISPTS